MVCIIGESRFLKKGQITLQKKKMKSLKVGDR